MSNDFWNNFAGSSTPIQDIEKAIKQLRGTRVYREADAIPYAEYIKNPDIYKYVPPRPVDLYCAACGYEITDIPLIQHVCVMGAAFTCIDIHFHSENCKTFWQLRNISFMIGVKGAHGCGYKFLTLDQYPLLNAVKQGPVPEGFFDPVT